jgi:hypothetical protein
VGSDAPAREDSVPDYDDPAIQIAQRTLDPLLWALGDALAEEDVAHETIEEVFAVAAEIYLAGRRDGQRQAVGQIAPEAARHGLHLLLAPELEEPPPERYH